MPDRETTCSLSMYSEILDEKLGTVTIMQNGKEYKGKIIEVKMNVYQVLAEDGTEIILKISRSNAGTLGVMYINGELCMLDMTESYMP